MNGYVEKDDEKFLWIGKRSDVKQTYPGMLDHLVAGGLVCIFILLFSISIYFINKKIYLLKIDDKKFKIASILFNLFHMPFDATFMLKWLNWIIFENVQPQIDKMDFFH